MYKILAVDDAKDTLMLLEFDLSDEGYQVIMANSGEQALEMLVEQKADLILLDMYMPGLSGLATLEQLKQNAESANVPVIMLSASNDDDEIVAALELGADDYVTKPYIAKVLLARIRTSLRLMEKTLELEQLAKTDFLTGLNNRGSFEVLGHQAINQCERNEHSLVLAMFDIDFFKQVNDDYGHEAGDKVLVEFSAMLSQCFRSYDIVGRIGGEEFAVCMPNISLIDAQSACERLRESVENLTVSINDDEISITVSIGLSLMQGNLNDLNELLKMADAALYQAKTMGRNKVVYLDENAAHDEIMSSALADEAAFHTASITKDNDASGKYPGIDLSIGVANVLGDENLFDQIVNMFYEDHHHDSNKISQAIESADHESIKHIVHTLKGVACSVGAMNLFELTKTLDRAINENQSDSYLQLAQPVQVELEKIMKGIERYNAS